MVYKFIKNEIVKTLVQISSNKNIPFDSDQASEYFKQTFRIKLPEIIETAKIDAKSADIMQNLNNNRIDPLVQHSFKISLKHAIVKYSEEILSHSKI